MGPVVLKALDRKLVRDLWRMKGQAAAIALVIAAGIGTFVMSLSTLRSLMETQQTYYDRYRFAHVFAHLKRAPLSLADAIAAIPGVAGVQPRIVVSVNLDVEGLAEPAVGKLISIPDRREAMLNDIHLRRGRYIDPDRPGEVLAGESFAEKHNLNPGDRLTAIINGRRQQLHIVGIALSPEHILQIREGDLLPDTKRFGVFWIGREELEAAFDLDGAFNDVTLSLMRGANEIEVIDRLDRLIEPYGGVGAYGRSEQQSHRYLTDEIKQLKSMGIFAPAIFLFVAAFLLNVVLSRLVQTQRTQIAALKAFGYSNRQVGWHYLKLVLLITLVGAAIGSALGVWLGGGLTKMYTRFYKFPLFVSQVDGSVIVWAVGLSTTAAVLGTLGAVRHAVAMPPAEAMRPEPPHQFRPTIAERIGLQRLFSPAARMILRYLERKPLKAAMSCFGIALAVAVLILGSFMEDALDVLIDFQFYNQQRHDVTVAFNEPTTGRSRFELAQLPGVRLVEPFRSVPTRMRHGHRHRRIGLMGVDPDAQLFRLLDRNGKLVSLPEDGVVISAKLAEILDVGEGDRVTVEVLEGQRPVRQVRVAGLIQDFAGLNAYMSRPALNRLMREGPSLSGAFLTVDTDRLGALYAELKQTPGVASVSVKGAMLQSFRDTIAENLMRMRAVNIIFASVIAFGVVYNTARIALSERGRELATLRVIGYTRGEISAILLGELAVLTLIALPIGMALGYGFAVAAMLPIDTEVFRIPMVIDRSTYGFAAAVTIIAALISGLIVRRRLDHLDLVSVLKAAE